MLVLRKPRTEQPQDFGALDWGDSITAGLLFHAPLHPGWGMLDLVSGAACTKTGLGTSAATPAGVMPVFGSGSYADFTAPANFDGSLPFSIAWVQQPISPTGYSTVLDVRPPVNAANSFLILQSEFDITYQFVVGPRDGGGNGKQARFDVGLQTHGRLDMFVLVAPAGLATASSAYVLYRNGVRQAAAVASPAFGAASPTGMRVGSVLGSPGDPFEGLLGCVSVWARVLSDTECLRMSTQPQSIYAPQIISIPWPAASSGVSGTLARTNANDTSSAAGTTTVRGTLARTNANDTAAASGSTTVTGSLARTNANDTAAASGSVGSSGVSGSLAATNANDTSAATGTTTIVGTLAKTNNNDTSTASGSPVVSGALARTNANDTVVASGAAGAITGTVAYTNNDDTVEARGVGAPSTGAGGLIRSTYHKPSPRLWWLRKPKHLDESEAEDALEVAADAIVSKVAEQVANKATPSEAKKAVKKAIAPALGVMPGFDWNAFYQEAMKAGQLAADEQRAMTQAAIKTQIVLEMQALQQRRFDDDEDDVAILAMLL